MCFCCSIDINIKPKRIAADWVKNIFPKVSGFSKNVTAAEKKVKRPITIRLKTV